MVEWLTLVGAHVALILLRSSLSSARFLHILRCADTQSEHEIFERIDRLFDDALVRILNIGPRRAQLQQARLPLRMGLGIRSVRDRAAPCILSSVHATQNMVEDLLPEDASQRLWRLWWNIFAPLAEHLRRKCVFKRNGT